MCVPRFCLYAPSNYQKHYANSSRRLVQVSPDVVHGAKHVGFLVTRNHISRRSMRSSNWEPVY
jgi:hypothetical protein